MAGARGTSGERGPPGAVGPTVSPLPSYQPAPQQTQQGGGGSRGEQVPPSWLIRSVKPGLQRAEAWGSPGAEGAVWCGAVGSRVRGQTQAYKHRRGSSWGGGGRQAWGRGSALQRPGGFWARLPSLPACWWTSVQLPRIRPCPARSSSPLMGGTPALPESRVRRGQPGLACSPHPCPGEARMGPGRSPLLPVYFPVGPCFPFSFTSGAARTQRGARREGE